MALAAAADAYQPRLRRESYGALIQVNGSQDRWFKRRGEPSTILVFIDDATSRLVQLPSCRARTRPLTSSFLDCLALARALLEMQGNVDPISWIER